jgi:hypothetical protein
MRLLFLIVMLFCHSGFAQNNFAPFREGKSNYVTDKQALKAHKQFANNGEELLKSLTTELALYPGEEDLSFEKLGALIQKAYESVPGRKTDFSYIYQNVLILMRSHDLIDDMLYRLLNDYFEQLYFMEQVDNPTQNRPEGPGILLKDYSAKKDAIKRAFDKMSKYKDEVVSSEQLNPFPIKQFKMKAGRVRDLSARERIYYLYSPVQIREMASIMDLALSIADAKNVYTTIEFRNGSAPLVLTHSPTEQYRLALRIMRTQKEEAEGDRSRIGSSVNDLDLITSAYELGILSYDEVSLIANNKDFYLPDVSFGKKVVSYFASLASIAIRVHPVTAPYAIIPMMIYNSYSEIKKTQTMIDEDSFIFSLPKRK